MSACLIMVFGVDDDDNDDDDDDDDWCFTARCVVWKVSCRDRNYITIMELRWYLKGDFNKRKKLFETSHYKISNIDKTIFDYDLYWYIIAN